MNLQQTQKQIDDYADQNYKYGFETLIESERSEKGLNEDTIKFISAKKKELKTYANSAIHRTIIRTQRSRQVRSVHGPLRQSTDSKISKCHEQSQNFTEIIKKYQIRKNPYLQQPRPTKSLSLTVGS